MKNLDQKEFKPYLLNRFMVVGWFCFRRFFFWGGGGEKIFTLAGTVLSGSVKPQMGIVVPQMGEVPKPEAEVVGAF